MYKSKVNLETGARTSRVYRLANNNWYAVDQDEDKVLLINKDSKFDYANGSYSIAPAFYLNKDCIDYITVDGEIILKPNITYSNCLTNQQKEDIYKEVWKVHVTKKQARKLPPIGVQIG